MSNREFIEEILDVLRNMDNAIDVICNLDVDAVLEHLGADEEDLHNGM